MAKRASVAHDHEDNQSAPQNPVDDAQDAVAVDPPATHKKKKKKRSREQEPADEAVEQPVKEKKKKKRKHRHDDKDEDKDHGQEAQQAASGTLQIVMVDPAAAPSPEEKTEEPKKKKKSKKKDKGKEKEKEPVAQPAPVPVSSETPEPMETAHHPPPPFPPFSMPEFSPDGMPHPPPPFGYPPPHFPPYPVPPPQYMPFPQHQPYPPYPPPFHPNMPPPPHPHAAFPPPHAPYFPPGPGGPPGMPFPPEMNLGSSEDILRALQDLDVSKIANVLKTLNDAAAAANIPPVTGPRSIFMPPQMPPPPPPPVAAPQRPPKVTVGKKPATAEAILGRHRKEKVVEPARRVIESSLLVPDAPTNPEHARMLATRWLSASKLAEMVKKEGLVYKKGKFSVIEEMQLKNAMENYRIKNALAPDQLNELIFRKTDKRDQEFWSELTSAVPQRPIIAVYHHVRREYHPQRGQGKWMPSEDELLIKAVTDVGQQWEKVSAMVGRMAGDCRDRYRNHIVHRDVRTTGHWTREEEEELTRIVTEMTIQQGKDMDNDVFWGQVAERMGNRRGRQQCRIKWTDALSKTVKNEGKTPRWSQQDAHILVHKVDSLTVRDDTEIDWKTLPDPTWNLWSAHTLQRRWMTLKKSVRGYEEMTHQEIMDILRVKKAELPPPNVRKSRKTTSAETITDGDNDAESEEDEAMDVEPVAGSSTGPGTLADKEKNETQQDDSEEDASEDES